MVLGQGFRITLIGGIAGLALAGAAAAGLSSTGILFGISALDPISFGLGLVKLASGAVLNFDQIRVNDEVWLPAHISVRADARLVYLRKLREELDISYRDYQKFQADSKIVE